MGFASGKEGGLGNTTTCTSCSREHVRWDSAQVSQVNNRSFPENKDLPCCLKCTCGRGRKNLKTRGMSCFCHTMITAIFQPLRLLPVVRMWWDWTTVTSHYLWDLPASASSFLQHINCTSLPRCNWRSARLATRLFYETGPGPPERLAQQPVLRLQQDWSRQVHNRWRSSQR